MDPNGAVAGTAVAVDGLTVRYAAHTVLDRVDLHIPAGTAVALVGENGAGKSTLLRCVAGLQVPTAGSVLVFGVEPGRSVEFWRDVATTVENPSWYLGLTVREHLELVRVANGVDPGDGQIERICTALGMDGLDDSLPSTLSSGQRQRFLLTAALVRPSRLLLLDEPEQRLDAVIRRAVAAHLREYVESGGTLLVASHDTAFLDEVGCRVVTVSSTQRRPVGHE